MDNLNDVEREFVDMLDRKVEFQKLGGGTQGDVKIKRMKAKTAKIIN